MGTDGRVVWELCFSMHQTSAWTWGQDSVISHRAICIFHTSLITVHLSHTAVSPRDAEKCCSQGGKCLLAAMGTLQRKPLMSSRSIIQFNFLLASELDWRECIDLIERYFALCKTYLCKALVPAPVRRHSAEDLCFSVVDIFTDKDTDWPADSWFPSPGMAGCISILVISSSTQSNYMEVTVALSGWEAAFWMTCGEKDAHCWSLHSIHPAYVGASCAF